MLVRILDFMDAPVAGRENGVLPPLETVVHGKSLSVSDLNITVFTFGLRK